MNHKVRADEIIRPTGTTFLIKVMFTQNASMQGFVQWIEQEKALPFRSCLELFHLMEGALEIASKGDSDKIKLRSWE